MKYIIVVSILISSLLVSCDKEDIDPGKAPNSELAGSWTVSEYNLNMEKSYGPSIILTYNTASNDNQIWVDNIYDSGIKIKANVDSKESFSASNTNNVGKGSAATVDISETKILGDSIIFRVKLYKADGSEIDDYYEAGHRTTGWSGDTHH